MPQGQQIAGKDTTTNNRSDIKSTSGAAHIRIKASEELYPAEKAYFQWIFGDDANTEVIGSNGAATSQWFDVSALDFNKMTIQLITTLSASTGTNGVVVSGSHNGIDNATTIEVQDTFAANDTILLDGGLFDSNVYPFIRVVITDDSTTAGTVKGFIIARGA